VPGYLLDTNIVSELRKRKPHIYVAAWFDSVRDEDIHLSVLVVGEIRQGINRLRRRDPGQADAYEEWLSELSIGYRERLEPIDMAVAEEWGRLNAERTLPVVDGLMAATARVHKWTLVTRNVRDFPASVDILNPFEPPE
jgi:predicted nucleic acid-binding protein